MNIIRFSHDWNNKLENPVFTTIRKWDYKKEMYYGSAINAIFKILLNKYEKGFAKLIHVDTETLRMLPQALICSDTGMIYNEALILFRSFGIQPDDKVIILTYKKEL